MNIAVNTPYGPGQLVSAGKYRDGSEALRIVDDEGPICTLTVNLDTGPLKPGYYLVKTWSENERTCAMLLEQGIFEDTGARVPTGFVQAAIWQLKE